MTVLDAFSLKHIIWWEVRGHARLASPLNPALISSVFVCFTVSFLRDTERSCVTTYDSSCRKRFEKPSIGLNIGHALIKCTRLKRKQAIVAANEAAEKDVDQFLALH